MDIKKIAKDMSNNGGSSNAIDTLYDLLEGFPQQETIKKSDIREIIEELGEL